MQVADLTACALYRSVMPWAACHQQLADEGIQLDQSTSINANKLEYDCYIFHRVLAPGFWPILWDMKYNAGKKIVWDLDDNLFRIPSWSSASEMMGGSNKQSLTSCLEMADHITLTTDGFRDQFTAYSEDWAKKITVVPNLIDMNSWAIPNSEIRHGARRILWAGSHTHYGDLEIIVPAIEQIIDKYKDDVQFIFMGMMPDKLKMSKHNSRNELLLRSVSFFNSCDLNYYPQNLHILSPHIALIPVEQNDFNRAKSNIKYLEMSLAGAACIASDVGHYGQTINHGVDGLLTDNTTEEWFKSIDFLMRQDKSYLMRMNMNAQIKVREEYSWESKQRDTWMNFFRMLAGKEVATSSS